MHQFFLSTAAAFGLVASSAVAGDTPVIGIANFATCVTDSKTGKKEQENLESMRRQMANLIEDTEKELREISSKFEDSDYLDSLSPKAEEELKARFQTRQEELARYQNQFYQVMNQMQMQMLHRLNSNIAKAAEKVAHEKKLDYVINKDACFYVRMDLDVTHQVIAEMDKSFELDEKTKKLTDSVDPIQALDQATTDQAR